MVASYPLGVIMFAIKICPYIRQFGFILGHYLRIYLRIVILDIK